MNCCTWTVLREYLTALGIGESDINSWLGVTQFIVTSQILRSAPEGEDFAEFLQLSWFSSHWLQWEDCSTSYFLLKSTQFKVALFVKVQLKSLYHFKHILWKSLRIPTSSSEHRNCVSVCRWLQNIPPLVGRAKELGHRTISEKLRYQALIPGFYLTWTGRGGQRLYLEPQGL